MVFKCSGFDFWLYFAFKCTVILYYMLCIMNCLCKLFVLSMFISLSAISWKKKRDSFSKSALRRHRWLFICNCFVYLCIECHWWYWFRTIFIWPFTSAWVHYNARARFFSMFFLQIMILLLFFFLFFLFFVFAYFVLVLDVDVHCFSSLLSIFRLFLSVLCRIRFCFNFDDFSTLFDIFIQFFRRLWWIMWLFIIIS